jgi:hypothetical protein
MTFQPRTARLKVRRVEGRFETPRVPCGWPDCGTLVATLAVEDWPLAGIHSHRVAWLPVGFRRRPDGTVALSASAARRWAQASQVGTPWQRFVETDKPHGRSPYMPRNRDNGRSPYMPRNRDNGRRRIRAPRFLHDGVSPGLVASGPADAAMASGWLTFECPVCRRLSRLYVERTGGDRCWYCRCRSSAPICRRSERSPAIVSATSPPATTPRP